MDDGNGAESFLAVRKRAVTEGPGRRVQGYLEMSFCQNMTLLRTLIHDLCIVIGSQNRPEKLKSPLGILL